MKKSMVAAFIALSSSLTSHAGPYLGGALGYAVVNFNPDLTFSIPQASLSAEIDLDIIGQDFDASPILGYRWQWDRFRLATELQAFWTSITYLSKDSDPGSTITVELEHEYVWLVRPSYQMFPTTPLFLYANLGVARAKMTAKPDINSIQVINFNEYVWGYKAGLGLGYDITPNWTIRADYIFSQYQKISNEAGQDFGLPDLIPVYLDLNTIQSQYLIGVTYNW